MKKTYGTLILASLALGIVSVVSLAGGRTRGEARVSDLMSGGPFEGTITFASDAPSLPRATVTTHEIKGARQRFDLPTPESGMQAVYAIVDAARRKSWLVVEERHSVVELDAAEADAMAARTTPVSPAFDVVKTGEHDTVAGYRCEKWEIDAPGAHTSACVIPGFQLESDLPVPGIAAPSERAFPLRTITRDASGVVVRHVEVRRIERRPVEDSRFTWPSDYVKMDALDLLKQAQQEPRE